MHCLQRFAWYLFSVIFETFSKQKTILIIHILFLIYLINWIYVKKWFFSVGFVYCSIKQFSLNLKSNQQTFLFHFSKNNRILNRLSGLYTNQPPCIVFRWFIYTSLRGPLIKFNVSYLIPLGNTRLQTLSLDKYHHNGSYRHNKYNWKSDHWNNLNYFS